MVLGRKHFFRIHEVIAHETNTTVITKILMIFFFKFEFIIYLGIFNISLFQYVFLGSLRNKVPFLLYILLLLFILHYTLIMCLILN
jgi:hypothetical protein